MKIIAIPLLAALLFYLPAPSQALGRAKRPEIEKGDAWTYEHTAFPSETKRTYTIRVREVKAHVILTGSASTGSTFSRDWALRESKRGDQVTYRAEPGRPLLQFPLELGKRWNGNLDSTYLDGYVQRWRQAQAWVDKTEKVTVPAGTFDAFLIRYEGYYSGRSPGLTIRWVESIWYAPEARRWVKRDWTWHTSVPSVGAFSERQREELVSFTRGGKPPQEASQTQRPAE